MRLFIGTSLSMCVASILRGDVKLSQVYGIISGTCIEDDLTMIEVMEQYAGYAWEDYDWDEFEPIVWELFHNRFFWQPRLTHGMTYTGGKELWERVIVSNDSSWHPNRSLLETTASGIILSSNDFDNHLHCIYTRQDSRPAPKELRKVMANALGKLVMPFTKSKGA